MRPACPPIRSRHRRGGPRALLTLLAASVLPLLPTAGLPSDDRTEEKPARFRHADRPWEWSFPRDHGAHPGFGTEWWYFTGVVRDERGRMLGYELTFFRVALRPDSIANSAPWRARDLVLAHFAITDVEGERFLLSERLQRAAAGMAGAEEGDLRVWIGDWFAERTPDGRFVLHAHAPDRPEGESGPAHPAMGIDLELTIEKGPVLHGENGLSAKSVEGNEASYYYSIPRMVTSGTVRIGNERRNVSGTTWMDQEFFTGATPREGLGWDWFSARLDDGRDLMLYRVRRPGQPHARSGTLVEPDGRSRPIDTEGMILTPLDQWTSPHTGNRYPTAWRVELPAERATFTVRSLLDAQEVVAEQTVGFAYWEGLSRYEGRWGDVAFGGEGYVELTGYAAPDAR